MKGLHLHIDCASGAAGDMMLAALIDAGVPVDAIGAALDAIGAGRARLHVTRVVKHGIAAVDVKVDTAGELAGAHRHVHDDHAHDDDPAARRSAPHRHDDHAHDDPAHDDHTHDDPAARHRHAGHTHDDDAARRAASGTAPHRHAHDDHAHDHAHDTHHAHAGHAHYHYADIRRRIEQAPLTDGTRHRALDIFDRLARAEAKLHGTTVADIAFHEVGAIDSVVDIVGTAAALDWLSPAAVTCTGVAMGHGTLHCAHGVLPVPAPAALEVLREAGGVMLDGGLPRELCTPTGAAILAASVTRWAPAPTGTPVAIGWGAGDSDLADRANVVRATVISTAATRSDTVWQIEANLDDMSPELCGPASDAVFAAGALDVWWTPITMKKGRPALELSALATTETREAVIAAILRETTTIGVRYAPRDRTTLARRTVEVSTRYGTIPVKVAEGGDAVNAAPEYDACAAAARRHNVPVKLVFAAAIAAFDASR